MRAGSASRIEPTFSGAIEYPRLGWRQAGFVSFAYRLAHLCAPRSIVIASLALAFVFI
jgi:hypothetical protein